MSAHLSDIHGAAAAAALRRSLTLVVGLAAGLASAQTAKTDLTVTVFADHFVVADRSLDELDRLADVVTSMRPNGVTLNACGPGVTGSLMAAAHRFQTLPLRINVLGADERACSAASNAPAMAMRVRQGPTSMKDPAVDAYWARLMP